MSKRLIQAGIGIAMALGAFAVPSFASIALSLQFLTTATAGTINISGNSQNSSETLSSLSGIEYNEVWIQNAPNAADNGIWNLTSTSGSGYATLSWTAGGQLILSGEFTTCKSLCSGTVGTGATNQNLGTGLTQVSGNIVSSTSSMSFPYNGTPGFTTGSGSPTQANVTFGTSTSLSEIAILLTDLGETGSTGSYLTAGGVSGNCTGCSSSGAYSITAGSETLTASVTQTPEPVSFFLLGSGLLGIGFVARKRRIQG